MTIHLFHELFAARVAEMPDAIALSAAGETLTFGELAKRVSMRARALRESGLEPGDRVALLQDRTVDLCTDLLACLAARLPVTILSRREAMAEAARKLAAAGCARLICDELNAAQGDDIATTAGIPSACRAPGARTLPLWDGAPPDSQDEALFIFTSGSSGTPKAVRISQANLAANTAGLAQVTPTGPKDHILHVMPLSHTNGICNQIVLPLAFGARVTLLPHFRADEVLEAMAELHPTIITGVPTMFQRLLPLTIPPEATHALRMLRCGSAPLPPETHARIEAHLGVEVLVSYGQTELTCSTTANPPGAARHGSVGQVIPGSQMAILAPDGTIPLPTGQSGEVCFRGPTLAMGYIDQPPFERGAWFRTGDCGYVDDAGYLFLTGRLKDFILRGGENLSPGQIEDLLVTQPGIEAACVVAAADADLGEVPFAFVEAKGTPDLNTLNTALKAALSPSHRLAGLEVLDQLPVNRVGKVDRRALARRVASR